nr:LOW QUALITY PROTEIN: transmembrane protein 79 [Microcebus murinus]
MTEPESLALQEVKGSEVPEKSPPEALVPNGRQPEGEGGGESPGAESLRMESSAGSPTAIEGAEDGLDSTVSEAATLPWGTGPQPSAPFLDPPGWRNIEPEPLKSEPTTKLEELPEDDANLLPEKVARAFVPIDLQCIERRPQEDLIVCCEASEGERRTFLPTRVTHPEPPECKWAEAVVRPPGRSCGGCGSCGGREGLRAVASVGAALVLFPCLLYGAYAFLPFDAPRLPTMSSRLVYTLRCGVFATFPIILGEPGPMRREGASGNPNSPGDGKETSEQREQLEGILGQFPHRQPIANQLTASLRVARLFSCLHRLIYWLTFAVGRSFRGFGYGLTFLPLLSMLVWNLYYMFVVEPERMLTAAESRLDYPDHARSASDYRPRPWG